MHNGLSYELGIGEKTSVVVGAGYGSFSVGDSKYTNFGGEAQYRYYFSEKLKGWYGAGRTSFSSGEVSSTFTTINSTGTGFVNKDTTNKFTSFGGGVLAGYQWLFDSGFVIDLNLGAAYQSFSYKADGSNSLTIGLKASGIFPTFGFGLGYAF